MSLRKVCRARRSGGDTRLGTRKGTQVSRWKRDRLPSRTRSLVVRAPPLGFDSREIFSFPLVRALMVYRPSQTPMPIDSHRRNSVGERHQKPRKKQMPIPSSPNSTHQLTASRRSRGTMGSMSAAAMSDTVESIFLDGWTDFPALRAVPEERRERLEAKFERLLASHDRTNLMVSGDAGARVVPLGGGTPGRTSGKDPVTPPRVRADAIPSGNSDFGADTTTIPDPVLVEHFGFLKMLHRQLINAVADFGVEESEEFRYVDDGDAGGGGSKKSNRSNPKRRPRLVVPPDGLSPQTLEDITNAAQWIGCVVEGAARVHRVVLASVEPPEQWLEHVPENAKEAVGVHLYNDLNEHQNDFDPDKVADQEGYAGRSGGGAKGWTEKSEASNALAPLNALHHETLNSDSDSEPDVKSNQEACELLNQLERAEYAWRQKKQNQEVLDSLRTVRIDPTAVVTLGLVRSPGTGRVKDITRRIANASALGETIRARYPHAPPTALQRTKQNCIRGETRDVATAALEAFARCLCAVATALTTSAIDVHRAHYRAIQGSGSPENGRLVSPGGFHRRRSNRLVGWWQGDTFVDKWRRASRLTGEWWTDTGRQLRAEVEALTGVRVVDVKKIACCGASGDSGRLGR